MMKIELALSKDKLLAREPNVSLSGGEPKRERIFSGFFHTFRGSNRKNLLFGIQ